MSREDYGLNGNGHSPKFGIVPSTDPNTLLILDARRNALAEPRSRMDRAKYLFAEVLDRALNPFAPGFLRKGVIVIPDSELARQFGVWESTIYNWKKQVEECGYFWTSKQYRSDRWPITVYHITALHPRPPMNAQNPDGTSNAGRRSAPGQVGEPTGRVDEKTGQPKVWSHGARKPGQKDLPLTPPPVPSGVRAKKPEKSKNRPIVAVGTNPDRLSATTGTGCQPRWRPADSHNRDRLTATRHRG